MPDFRIHLDKNVVIKLLTELVPFETSGHETQEDYDDGLKELKNGVICHPIHY